VQTERKTCRLLAEMAFSAVRKNPRKHAVVGKKKPTPKGWFFLYWWSWRDLNPRPQAFFEQIYMFSVLIWVSP